MRPTILPFAIWLGIFLALVLLLHPRGVLADALAEARTDKARIVLYKDDCALKTQITNMPYRATWDEGGKTFEGCWAAYRDIGLVVAYFDDKTIALIAMSLLVKVHST